MKRSSQITHAGSPRSRRRRAGLTLIEMTVVVTGTVALVSAGAATLVAVRRVAATARTAAEEGTALSRLHRTLRADAADARARKPAPPAPRTTA